MKRLLLAASALMLAPFAQAAEITVDYSEEFTETLQDDYGLREGEYLSREVAEDIERAFRKAGVDVARVDVTIVNAKPNRPTFKQLGDRQGLDLARSIGIGGMELEATAYGADGEALTTFEYGWYENQIGNTIGSTTWTDANRASRFFAKRFARELQG